MSDLERLKKLFKERRITFKEELRKNEETDLVFYQGEEGVSGYNGFMAVLSFNKDGILEEISAWE